MNPRQKAWMVMIAAYLASVAVALNEFKVPPVMEVLIEKLKVDLATGGWLMSSFAVAGVILGIPAAIMLGKLGPKSSGLIALGCTILGSAIGALANDPVVLLFGRVVEGIGLGVITVVAPALISMWFPPEEWGTPMGIWASWVPLGSFLMFNLAGPLAGSFGWQGVWWFGALFALVAFVIYATVVAAPEAVPLAAGGPPPFSTGGFGKLLLNPASWILALVFGTFNFAFIAFSTWAPLYLNKELGIEPGTSSFDTSLSLLAIIPSTILAGWVLDRTRNRYRVLTAALLIAGILLIWSFQLSNPSMVVPYLLVLGLVGGFIPTSTFTLAPETMPRPELAGLALGIVSVGQNLGMFVGPPVVGAIIAGGNWAAGVIPLVGSIAIGFAASLLLHRRHTKARPVINAV
jgi:MFS family permease